jgi:polysaccharide export outer membrane protein
VHEELDQHAEHHHRAGEVGSEPARIADDLQDGDFVGALVIVRATQPGKITLKARAEGLTGDAGTEVLLSRTKSAEGERELIRIPVIELMQMAKPELNYVLKGGEEIRIPDAQKVYVVGNVKKPGAYTVRDGTPMTILKVLALAEGLERYAQKDAYIYRAEGSGGARKEIVVQLSRLMERKRPDELLQPEDVLYIPESKGKKATLGALEKAASFGMATASGVLIWH